MEIEKYLKCLIEDKSDYELTEEDTKCIKHEGINKFILGKLNSSKYKATSISEDYKNKVLEKINLCIFHDEPIYITLPFGATKNPYLSTAPGVDWAEVFNLSYIRNYLKPIAKAYEHGVILDYISVAVFENVVNRISIQDSDIYDEQFGNLAKCFQSFLPENFTLKYTKVGDLIPRERLERLIKNKMEELRKIWRKQSQGVIDYKLLRAKRNSVYDPSDKNLDKLIMNSALGHDSFCSECWTTDAAPWDKKNMITLGHTYTKGWAIHVRSAPGSTVNFWSGVGVLQNKDEKLIPTVLSPTQYNEAASHLSGVEINYFDKAFSNLQEIQILK